MTADGGSWGSQPAPPPCISEIRDMPPEKKRHDKPLIHSEFRALRPIVHKNSILLCYLCGKTTVKPISQYDETYTEI